MRRWVGDQAEAHCEERVVRLGLTMRIKRALSILLLAMGVSLVSLAIFYAGTAVSTWRTYIAATPRERAEATAICEAPWMDCHPDPTHWLRLAALFGFPGGVAIASYVRLQRSA